MEGLENVEIQLKLTVGETNLILASLSELPFKVSSELIHKIRQQGDQQVSKLKDGQPVGGSNSP